jgi:hypothetical protein
MTLSRKFQPERSEFRRWLHVVTGRESFAQVALSPSGSVTSWPPSQMTADSAP